MRWLWLGVLVLSGMTTTGCPSEFGKDGRISKTVHKDSREQIIIIKRCTRDELDRACAPGKENSLACLECGGPP